MLIELPPELTIDTIDDLVDRWSDQDPNITIDLSRNRWVHPIGTVALSCLAARALTRGCNPSFKVDGCRNLGYWQRMRFFENFGLSGIPSGGEPKPAEGRFSEVTKILDINDTDRIAEELVRVASPAEEALHTYSHIVSEALNNVCQHSRGQGFCASQYYPSEGDVVRFCIGDSGIGIRESLSAYRPGSDQSAIEKALELGISGRTQAQQRHEPRHMRNRGVGLSAIKRLIEGNNGSLTIWSGSAKYLSTPSVKAFASAPYWQGTIVSVELRRNEVGASFHDVMRAIRAELQKIEMRK